MALVKNDIPAVFEAMEYLAKRGEPDDEVFLRGQRYIQFHRDLLIANGAPADRIHRVAQFVPRRSSWNRDQIHRDMWDRGAPNAEPTGQKGDAKGKGKQNTMTVTAKPKALPPIFGKGSSLATGAPNVSVPAPNGRQALTRRLAATHRAARHPSRRTQLQVPLTMLGIRPFRPP